jgi:trehalose synthase
VTKKIHNALQGAPVSLSEEEKSIYEEVAIENAMRMHIDHDVMVVHDPQPLPLIAHLSRETPSIWCCHIDLSEPNREVWDFLAEFIERYDTTVFSLPEYAQELASPQHFIMPAINPFSMTNKELSSEEIACLFEQHDIPHDLPLIVQVSRFDKWKDPLGVVEACWTAGNDVDCRLVLLGNRATDDPEGDAFYEECCQSASDRVLVLSVDDALLVNALQRKAAVVLQKSTREGFGLTVSEAMWKGTPVIGGNVGGIRHQITDGRNGFLVDSNEDAANGIVKLLKDPALCDRMGREAQRTVRDRFLMTRLLEQWLDLFAASRTGFL